MHAGDLLLVLLAGFVVWRLIRARQRRQRIAPGTTPIPRGRDDAAARLLGWAVGLLAAQRVEWGQAMIGELDRIDARMKRWRFAAGCVAAALLMPPWGRAAAAVSTFAVAGVGCLGLYAYTLIRYPSLDSSAATWVFLGILLILLLGYLLAGSVLAHRPAVAVPGLLGGLFVLTAWLILDGVTGPPTVSWGPPILTLVVPLLVGAFGAWRGGTTIFGRRTALLAGLSASLGVFIIGAIGVIATGGGPYTPGQITEAGTANVTTYVVSDGLGNGVILMLLLPLITTMIGWAGAALTARLRHV